MATDREEFKDYVMRRLGWPVQQINIDDEQLEDRIDDALSFYKDYHYDGIERVILKHEITPTDITNGYITFPEVVQGINRILAGFGGNGTTNWMSPMYQITLDAVMTLTSTSLIPYHLAMSHIAELAFMFDSTPGIRFNRHRNQLFLHDERVMVAGNWIVVEATRYLDPADYSDVWNDRWLKKYATALVKKQWAENMKLFSGVALLGGVTMDAVTMWQEADNEIVTLEQEIIHSYGADIYDRIG